MALNGVKLAVTADEKTDRVGDLVERSSKGSGEAFGQLYQLYVDRIYNYIYYKTGHSVDAEDLTEQVFIKA
ncbi:MAG: hypothetical protein ACRDHX_15625, partial [Chloroflexota bacterium]